MRSRSRMSARSSAVKNLFFTHPSLQIPKNQRAMVLLCLFSHVKEDRGFHTCSCVKRGTKKKKREIIHAIQGRVERQKFSLSETVCRVDGIASVP